VQGRLRNKHLSVEIKSECGDCGRRMRFEVTSDLKFKVVEGGKAPLLFEPSIDWTKFVEPNIVHAY